MDRITRALLNEFVEQSSLQALAEDKAFEQFCGYLVTSGHYSESFASDDITVGAGGDCGIDCIAIIINGTLVTEPEEVADLATANGYLDVTFIFTQAERSTSFETAKIGQFVFGVCDFFAESPHLPQNDRVHCMPAYRKRYLTRVDCLRKGILNAFCTTLQPERGRTIRT